MTTAPDQLYTHAPVTLTAQVSGGDGGGTVSFYHFAVLCDSVPLIDYTATCTVPSSPAIGNPVSVDAIYSGDSVSGSSGDSVIVTPLGPSPTSVSLSLSSPGASTGRSNPNKRRSPSRLTAEGPRRAPSR